MNSTYGAVSGFSRTKVLLVALLALGVFPVREASAVEPCCSITAIDARSGVVSARETATGRAFQFRLDDAALLVTVKVGQAVDADFKTMKVTVRPAQEEPCCGITAIDARSGAVSVKDHATGRVSQLTVKDTKLLGTLKVGQTVVANAATGSITVAPTGMILK
jgi:hypothetical protein